MMPYLATDHETYRLTAFLAVLALLALAEACWPRRMLTVAKPRRWFVNLSIVALDTLAARLLLPLAPMTLAALAQTNGWGLFNRLGVSGWTELLVSVLLLDLLIYLQHRLFHRVPLFWRMHRMHHTDLDIDVTSGTRFHPLEIILSLGIKATAVLLLGCSPLAVLLFEVLLNATSMFSHANLRLPLPLDRWLRNLLVTPDMHRIHHSVHPRETDSNFGFCLPWWDRLLGTYRDQPRDGHDLMVIGLREFRDSSQLGLWQLLKLPFFSNKAGTTP